MCVCVDFVLQAALLHDTVEDTDTSPAELEAKFGPIVARIVQEVTDDKSLPKQERKRQQVEHAPHCSRQAKLVKLADKLYNLRDLNRCTPVGQHCSLSLSHTLDESHVEGFLFSGIKFNRILHSSLCKKELALKMFLEMYVLNFTVKTHFNVTELYGRSMLGCQDIRFALHSYYNRGQKNS